MPADKPNFEFKKTAGICPRCGAARLVPWSDLKGDERLLASKLAASAEFTASERKRHRFCTRCWFEEALPVDRNA